MISIASASSHTMSWVRRWKSAVMKQVEFRAGAAGDRRRGARGRRRRRARDRARVRRSHDGPRRARTARARHRRAAGAGAGRGRLRRVGVGAAPGGGRDRRLDTSARIGRMPPISRGFHGRRPAVDPARVPPGQYVVEDFPVLSAGPTPRTPLEQWNFTLRGEVDATPTLDLGRVHGAAAARRSPSTSTASRSGRSSTRRGRASRSTRCCAGSSTEAEYVTAFCDGGYTTNLPLEDLTDGKAWVVAHATRASRSPPSTAARRACSCRTCTSGRAPSGCAA